MKVLTTSKRARRWRRQALSIRTSTRMTIPLHRADGVFFTTGIFNVLFIQQRTIAQRNSDC